VGGSAAAVGLDAPAGVPEQVARRRGADGHERRVALDGGPVGELDPAQLAVLPCHELAETGAHAQIHSVRLVAVGKEGPDLGAEHPDQRSWLEIDQRDLHAERTRRGRHLSSHEARADDRQPGAGPEAGAEALRVGRGAERAHAGRALERESARLGAGRDHDRVRRRRAGDRSHGDVQSVDPLAEHEPDVALGPVRLGPQLDPLLLAREELLRQRRALVGSELLVAHERHLAVEALSAQGLGAA
jgi:hypothetical protein